jgi:hypothetical protein
VAERPGITVLVCDEQDGARGVDAVAQLFLIVELDVKSLIDTL